MQTETRTTAVLGTHWILPHGQQTPVGEPNRRLFVHVIPQNVAYQLLLYTDVSIQNMYNAITEIMKNDQDPLPKYRLYFKKTLVKIEDNATNTFTSGATFLLATEHSLLPKHHSGNVWQCKSCVASFETFDKIMHHLTTKKNHRILEFGVPINWGRVIAFNARQKKMNVALIKEEPILDKFIMDDQDLEWELVVARKFVVINSKKYQSSKETMDPDFIISIMKGTQIPKDCARQLTGTWTTYQPFLRKIVTSYQHVEERPLHYRNFFAFGTMDLVQLSDPEIFLETYENASPEMKKKFLASHNLLQELVLNVAISPQGLTAFEKPYKDTETARRDGTYDREVFFNNIDLIRKSIENKSLWSKYSMRADAKRKHSDQLHNKLLDSFEIKSNSKLKDAIEKFLASDFSIQKEKDLVYAAGTPTEKLSAQKWNEVTEWVVTRLQVFSGGRREASDMTVGDWENRHSDENGSAIIDRTFTKLEGHLETFLHLDPAEVLIVDAYERARRNQFPELDKMERRGLKSVFLNSAGNAYIGKKGNPSHLSHWNAITDRCDVPTEFRDTMANWSLSTDLVTRANSAFVCAHSLEIMTKVYANREKKKEKGVQVLQRYRHEELGLKDSTTSRGRYEFFTKKLPPQLTDRQRQLRIDSYDSELSKAIRTEKDSHLELHSETPEKPASTESRASLLELIAEEYKSGVAVSEDIGFLADMLLKKEIGQQKKKYWKESKVFDAILNAIDSPRFAEHPAAISLSKILVMAASAKLGNDVKGIEQFVLDKWVKQIERFTRRGTRLKEFRTRAAFVTIANIAKTTEKYCVGNRAIAGQVAIMQNARKKLENDDQTNEELDVAENTTPMKEDEDNNTNNTRKRKSKEALESPPPIKVKRKGGMRRTLILYHILKSMKDPTRACNKAGLAKMDLEINVLPKVRPHFRKLDKITAEYYRYIYQLDFVYV